MAEGRGHGIGATCDRGTRCAQGVASRSAVQRSPRYPEPDRLPSERGRCSRPVGTRNGADKRHSARRVARTASSRRQAGSRRSRGPIWPVSPPFCLNLRGAQVVHRVVRLGLGPRHRPRTTGRVPASHLDAARMDTSVSLISILIRRHLDLIRRRACGRRTPRIVALPRHLKHMPHRPFGRSSLR